MARSDGPFGGTSAIGCSVQSGVFRRIGIGEVNVKFLGSGDAFGSGGRFHTCIYVRSDGWDPTHALIDCGASTLVAMKRFGVETPAVDTILVSHLHGDHFGGLPLLSWNPSTSRLARSR